LKIGAGIACALLVLWLIYPSSSQTVDQYRNSVITEINQDLMDANHSVRKRIESAHLSVVAKSAKVTSCKIKTIDGSDKAGKDGSNVSEVDVVITVIWDGIIQTDGYTEFQIVYDNQNNTVKEARFLNSNAMFNWETVDWWSVGWSIGSIIALL
jgi:hypothetical protein